MKKLLAAAAVAGLIVTPAAGQTDVAGKWEITFETPRGEITQIITFQQDSNTLTGTVERTGGSGGQRAGGGGRAGGRGGAAEIESGTVDGNSVSFVIVRSFVDRVFETQYDGTVDGDTITGTSTSRRGETPFTMTRITTD